METIHLRWNGYSYFPYEKDLARREIKTIGGVVISESNDEIQIIKDGIPRHEFDHLTYFHEIVFPDGSKRVPEQARLEASASSNGILLPTEEFHAITRQSTRYSAHGLHEYKGKFNPQVVRSIGNILKLPEGAWVLDPFCGSGTTLLECAHNGWNAIGVDLNPLGVLISNAKIYALHTPAKVLKDFADRLHETLRKATLGLDFEKLWSERQMKFVGGEGWLDSLPNSEYLQAWFPLPVLSQFALIIQSISSLGQESNVPFFQVILSDIVRDVSFQDPGDLRIRKRKNPNPNYPVVPMYLHDLDCKLTRILNAKLLIKTSDFYQEAFIGDSRLALDDISKHFSSRSDAKFDCAITSPPYATALPYIDTNRLSLCLLGLIESKGIVKLDRHLTGSREILETKRRILEDAIINKDSEGIPNSVFKLCNQMLLATEFSDDGFRRRNMPALIYSYFSDMADVLKSVKSVLKQSGIFALVVGRNRTCLNGQNISIDTPKLLQDMAVYNGWNVLDAIELNTYQRFDLHKQNSIRTESLLLLEK